MWKDDACLLEMLQAARDTTSFLEGRDEAGFYDDRVLHHAIMMLLVVIGENAHKISEDEAKPPKMLYPRDPSLDPQLVWKGKDEQDREPLEVDIVPIYIQEVIEPRVITPARK